MCHLHFWMKKAIYMHFIYSICNGNTDAAVEEYWHNFHSKQSETDLCLVHFINSCMKVAQRWMSHLLNIQCVGVWKRKMILFKRHTTIHVLVLEKLLPASTSHIWVSGKHDTTKDCIQNVPSKYSTLNVRTCEEGRAFATGLLHTHIGIIPVYSLMKHNLSLPEGSPHLQDHENLQRIL